MRDSREGFPAKNASFPQEDADKKDGSSQSPVSAEEVLLKLLHVLHSSDQNEHQSPHPPASPEAGVDRLNVAAQSGSGQWLAVPKAASLASQYSDAFPHFSSMVSQSPTTNRGAARSSALEDGQEWRKYGQKQAKGACYPRAYFRCAVHGCPAKKTVEQISDADYDVLYKEEHDHSKKDSSVKGKAAEVNYASDMDENTGGFLEFRPEEGSRHRSQRENNLLETMQAALLQEAINQSNRMAQSNADNNNLTKQEFATITHAPAQNSIGDLFDIVSQATRPHDNMPATAWTGGMFQLPSSDLPDQPEIELPTARGLGLHESLRVTPKFGEFLPPIKVGSERGQGAGDGSGLLSFGSRSHSVPPPPWQALDTTRSSLPFGTEFDFMGQGQEQMQQNPKEEWDLGLIVGNTRKAAPKLDPLNILPARIQVSTPVSPPWEARASWELSNYRPRSEPVSPLTSCWSPAASSLSNFSMHHPDDAEVESAMDGLQRHQQIKRKDSGVDSDFHPGHGEEDLLGGKKRRVVPIPRRTVKVPVEDEGMEDGYKWRKYGKKTIKDTPYERSYFRCTKEGCDAKKRVERSMEEPQFVIMTYEGRHTHNPLLFKARVRNSGSASGLSAAADAPASSLRGSSVGSEAFTSLVGAIANLGVRSEPSSPMRYGLARGNHFSDQHTAVQETAGSVGIRQIQNFGTATGSGTWDWNGAAPGSMPGTGSWEWSAAGLGVGPSTGISSTSRLGSGSGSGSGSISGSGNWEWTGGHVGGNEMIFGTSGSGGGYEIMDARVASELNQLSSERDSNLKDLGFLD